MFEKRKYTPFCHGRVAISDAVIDGDIKLLMSLASLGNSSSITRGVVAE
jgi:hypothetical protein